MDCLMSTTVFALSSIIWRLHVKNQKAKLQIQLLSDYLPRPNSDSSHTQIFQLWYLKESDLIPNPYYLTWQDFPRQHTHKHSPRIKQLTRALLSTRKDRSGRLVSPINHEGKSKLYTRTTTENKEEARGREGGRVDDAKEHKTSDIAVSWETELKRLLPSYAQRQLLKGFLSPLGQAKNGWLKAKGKKLEVES